MRKTFLSTLIVAVLLGTSGICLGQSEPTGEPKPLLTISFSGYDQWRGDMEYIFQEAAKLKSMPPWVMIAAEDMKQIILPSIMPGLDAKRPWGAIVQVDGMEFSVLGFIPVTILEPALNQFAALAGMDVEDNGDGTYTLETPTMVLIVKEHNGWAFVSDNPEALANLPADPVQLLGGQHEKYNLAIRATVKNLPPMLRQMAIATVQQAVQSQMEQTPGETDEDYAIRNGMAQRGLDQLVALLNDLDTVLLGWNIDTAAGSLVFDFEVKAITGTDTASQFAQVAQTQTNFAGFDLPGAAATANFASKLSDEAAEEAKGNLADLRDRTIEQLKDQELGPDELALATQVISDLVGVAIATVEGKQVDGGAVLMLKPGSVALAAGAAVADGAKLEAALKKLAAQIAKDSPELAAQMLKLDAESHQGVNFHKVLLPMPNEDIKPLVGDVLEVIVGIGDKAAYLAAGRDPSSLLKQVIDKSAAEAGKLIPPGRISLAGTQIAKFAASLAQDSEQKEFAEMMAAVLEESAGKDHLTITVRPITNGVGYRLEIEKGIMVAIPILASQAPTEDALEIPLPADPF